MSREKAIGAIASRINCGPTKIDTDGYHMHSPIAEYEDVHFGRVLGARAYPHRMSIGFFISLLQVSG